MAPDTGTNAQSAPVRSEIARFYAGKNVFITGASGFIGKVLVEKLLRSCPNVGKIYILLRSKKGLTPKQRLDQQFVNCKALSHIATSLITEKLCPIEGDLHSPELGLTDKSKQLLFDSVHVVFHVAASVRFDLPLRQAMQENVFGTKYVLDICHHMPYLKAFVHVSTSYAYCHLETTDERLYPMKAQPHQLLDLCTWMDDNSLEAGCSKLFEGRPNTYTFTKAVAEHYVDQNRGQIPVAIARPSIVTSSKKEPYSGWCDSINGPIGMALLGVLGVARTMECHPKNRNNMVPVDVVVNALIAIAWQTARCPRISSPVPVYNITSNKCDNITWEMFLSHGRKVAMEMPSMRIVRVPAKVPTERDTHWLLHRMYRLFSETLFAYIFDFLLIITGQKPLMVRLVRRMHNALEILQYFTKNQWSFPNENLLNLNKSLNETDRKVFDFDIWNMDWNEYLRNLYVGMRRYVLKEEDENVDKARKRFFKLKIIYGILNALIIMLFLYIGYLIIPKNYFNTISIKAN